MANNNKIITGGALMRVTRIVLAMALCLALLAGGFSAGRFTTDKTDDEDLARASLMFDAMILAKNTEIAELKADYAHCEEQLCAVEERVMSMPGFGMPDEGLEALKYIADNMVMVPDALWWEGSPSAEQDRNGKFVIVYSEYVVTDAESGEAQVLTEDGEYNGYVNVEGLGYETGDRGRLFCLMNPENRYFDDIAVRWDVPVEEDNG